MRYVSGITEKGSIWVKQLTDRGELLTKRVLKNHIQFDTYFMSGEPVRAIITDHVNDRQFVKIYKVYQNWFTKLKNKLLNRNSIDIQEQSVFNMKLLRQYDENLANLFETTTGYNNNEINNITQGIKHEYLKQIFR